MQNQNQYGIRFFDCLIWRSLLQAVYLTQWGWYVLVDVFVDLPGDDLGDLTRREIARFLEVEKTSDEMETFENRSAQSPFIRVTFAGLFFEVLRWCGSVGLAIVVLL